MAINWKVNKLVRPWTNTNMCIFVKLMLGLFGQLTKKWRKTFSVLKSMCGQWWLYLVCTLCHAYITTLSQSGVFVWYEYLVFYVHVSVNIVFTCVFVWYEWVVFTWMGILFKGARGRISSRAWNSNWQVGLFARDTCWLQRCSLFNSCWWFSLV